MNRVLQEYASAARRVQAKMAANALPRPLTKENRLAWIEHLINVYHPEKRCPVPLICNPMQRDIIESITDRELGLKSRRAGLTSIYAADAWIDILEVPGTKVELIAHDLETAEAIFDQVVRYQYERIPAWIKPKATTDNVRELKFKELDSYFKVMTAGQSESVAMKKGQARAISILIMTEFAFYAYGEDLFAKIVNCVPVRGGKIRIDSTPNGQNSFYRRFKEARDPDIDSEYLARFYPWWWDVENRLTLLPDEEIIPTKDEIEEVAIFVKEYRNPNAGDSAIPEIGISAEQLKFRRNKISSLQPKGSLTARDVFIVEYPEDEQSCFLHSGRPLFLSRDLKITCTLREAIKGHKHSIGHDASVGDATGHPAGTAVIDLDTGEQVYEWRGWEPTDKQAERLVDLQKRYPGLIIPERNFPGDSILMLLRRWGTMNVYKHRDRELREGVGVKAGKRKPGFPMSDLTKPRVFTDLEYAITAGHLKLAGKKSIDDLKGYQYNDTDRIEFMGSAEHYREAGELSHGELGIALGLAWWGRKVGTPGVG